MICRLGSYAPRETNRVPAKSPEGVVSNPGLDDGGARAPLNTGITAYLKNSGKLEVWPGTSPTTSRRERLSSTTEGKMRLRLDDVERICDLRIGTEEAPARVSNPLMYFIRLGIKANLPPESRVC